MKIILLAVCFCVAACSAIPVSEADLAAWKNFKATHSKSYATKEDELKRQYIFMNNQKYIKEHNKRYARGEESYDVGMNHFGDLTNQEFARMMNTFRPGMNAMADSVYKRTKDVKDLPASVDWRDKGYVTGVKNQGSCGSCWAFSTTGSLEGQHFNKTGKLVSLSEQNLVDCALPKGERGCDGYWMSNAFEYIIGNKGIDTEESYPYLGYDSTCKYDPKNKGAKVTGYVNITVGSEEDLQAAVAEVGPVSVAIDASHIGFQFYLIGVYKAIFCSTTNLDHGVLVVGYGHESGLLGGDYWIVKNSWGKSWGKSGYILMARNRKNMCGIATCASYPVV